MFALPDSILALHRQSLESARAVTLASFAGFEKLAQLNVQAAKASFEEGVEKSLELRDSRDPKALASSLSDAAQPVAEKASAYARHVAAILNETGTEIQKALEKQAAESHRQVSAAVDALAKSAPAGSEGVVTLVRSAMTATNTAWDQVNKATRQAVEIAEANVVSATEATRAAAAAKRKVA